MIFLVLFLSLSYSFISCSDTKKYVSVKPIEAKCLRKESSECISKTINIKLIKESTKKEVCSFTRSSGIENLRNQEGFSEFGEWASQNIKFIQQDGSTDQDIVTFPAIENFNIDDILSIFDYEKLSVISIRIKFFKKSEHNMFKITIVTINTISTTGDVSVLNKQNIDSFNNLYDFKVSDNKDKYEYLTEEKHICIGSGYTTNCENKFTSYHSFKHPNQSVVAEYASILDQYYLHATINKGGDIIKVTYKYHNESYEDTEDYTEVTDISCNNICKSKSGCTYVQENNVFNGKCTCENGFRGRDCKHKFSCLNCVANTDSSSKKYYQCKKGWTGDNCNQKDCESLGMCKNGGTCAAGSTTRTCTCSGEWTGPYCTKPTSTSSSSTTTTTTETTTTSSNAKMTLGVSIGSGILIIIVISAVLYVVKTRNG